MRVKAREYQARERRRRGAADARTSPSDASTSRPGRATRSRSSSPRRSSAARTAPASAPAAARDLNREPARAGPPEPDPRWARSCRRAQQAASAGREARAGQVYSGGSWPFPSERRRRRAATSGARTHKLPAAGARRVPALPPAQAAASRLPDLRHLSGPRGRAARDARARRRPGEARVRIRVAVDAMGGDRAPDEIVAGAREALSTTIEPVLFGPRDGAPAARAGPRDRGCASGRRDAREAGRRRPRQARQLALRRLPRRRERRGRRRRLRREHGRDARRGPARDRPPPRRAAAPPSRRRSRRCAGLSVLIDAGANADARPEHLLQFAHMGAIFARGDDRRSQPARSPCSRSARSRRRATGSSARRTRCSPRTRHPLHRQRRGAAALEGARRRRRLRRLHREHGAQGPRGHDPDACSTASARRSSSRSAARSAALMIRPAARGAAAPARPGHLRRRLPARPQGPRRDRPRELVAQRHRATPSSLAPAASSAGVVERMAGAPRVGAVRPDSSDSTQGDAAVRVVASGVR